MDFVSTLHGHLLAWSPNGKSLAAAVENKLQIRDSESLEMLQEWTCVDKIQQLEWGSDSALVLCAIYKRSVVQAWSLNQPDWTCKIDEGDAGLVHAYFTPDCRSIITTAEFMIRITIWSLVNKSCRYIKLPKFSSSRGVKFSSSGQFMAVAERKDCKDYISIFSCEFWNQVARFPVESSDLEGFSWSPDDSIIAVWDCAMQHALLLYSVDGRLLSKYEAYNIGLGIISVEWCPSGQLLGVANYDLTGRVLNSLTWQPIMEVGHETALQDIDDAVVYLEETQTTNGKIQPGPRVRAKYVIGSLPSVGTKISSKPQKMGFKWSCDGKYFSTHIGRFVYVWDMVKLRIAVTLVQLNEVKALKWSPVRNQLAICCGVECVYLWSPEGASCVTIPIEKFSPSGLEWNPDGLSLLLYDKGCNYSVAFLNLG